MINSYLMKLGFTTSEVDSNLYFKVEDDRPLILVFYVDDLFLIGADPLIHKCKKELAYEFEMKDLGLMHYFLGLEVWQKPREIFLSQEKYVVKILERFGMVDCKPVTTSMELNFKKLSSSLTGPKLENASEYHQLIGALMFLVNSRPDICFAVNTLSQYVGSVVDRKSTYGCFFSLGSASISWMSKKQKSVALSTAEAKYIVANMASCDAVYLRKIFSDLFGHVLDTTVIFSDNQSGI
eukprot:PITA_30216